MRMLGENQKPITEDVTRLQVRLSGGQIFTLTQRATGKGFSLEISGQRGIHIQPYATNSIYVRDEYPIAETKSVRIPK